MMLKRFHASLVAPLAAASLSLAACDPCAGVVACNTGVAAPVEGRIVETVTGSPIRGATVTVVTASGETLTATTGADGDWRIVVPAAEGDRPVIDVIVESPGAGSYRVTGLELQTFTRRGDANVLGSWVDRPNFPVLGEVYIRGTSDTRVAGATVRFTRTGGPMLSTAAGGAYRTATNEAGHFIFLGRDVFAAGDGALIGTLEISSASIGASVYEGFTLTPSYLFRDPWRVIRVGAGPSLEWLVEFRSTVDGSVVPGVQMEFRRTGGVMISPLAYTTVSNLHGHAALSGIRPAAEGIVIGDMHVRPPPPASPYVVTGLELPTFDGDGGRFLGRWGVGPGYPGPADPQPEPPPEPEPEP
jgi:hypothetical protein